MNFRRKLNQKAVYWPPEELNDLGKEVLGRPAQVDCKWEDWTEEKVTKTGEEWTSTARVYLTAAVEEGGWLWLGPITAIPDRYDPRTQSAAARIRMVETVPNRKATQTLRCAYL